MEYLFLCETIHTINIITKFSINNGVFVSKRNNPYHHNTITNNGVFVSKRNNPYHSLFHKVVYCISAEDL